MEQKNKSFYVENPFEKATDTRHVSHSCQHKLFYVENPFEKATDTRQISHFTIKTSYFTLKILLKRLRTLDTYHVTSRVEVDSVRSRVATGYQPKSLKASAQYVQD